MPTEQRCRRHHEHRPPATAPQTTQREEQRPVVRLKARFRILAAQDLELVTKHKDLDLLGVRRREAQQHQFHDPTDRGTAR